MKILEKEDIYSLLKENEEERINNQLLKRQIEESPTDFVGGKFDRTKVYRAFLFEDMHKDGFVIEYPHGLVVRQSDRKWHYRGENACYATSRPTFIRKLKGKSIEEKNVAQFVAILKYIDFFNILNKLDHYHNFKNMHFTHPNGVRQYLDVLFFNIAQHYGFDTNWLDITSDFEVALFFACCKYSNHKWIPLNQNDFDKNEESKCGRIFRRSSNDFKNFFHIGKYVVLPVGFQPFMRCHMQYAYAIAMDEDMDLTKSESGFEILKFKHSEELCNYIYSKMDNGKLIYPHEGLNIFSEEIDLILNSTYFSKKTFREAFLDLNFNYSEPELLALLKKSGIEIGSKERRIEQSKIAIVNKAYEEFDIEKTYNIKLRTRWTFTP